MKNIFESKKVQQFLAVYLAWVLLHGFLFYQSQNSYWRHTEEFWPFTSSELGSYDISEFIVYTFSPLVIAFVLYSFKDELKELGKKLSEQASDTEK